MSRMKRYVFLICVLALLVSTMGMGAAAENLAMASIPVTFHQGGSVPEDPETFTAEKCR